MYCKNMKKALALVLGTAVLFSGLTSADVNAVKKAKLAKKSYSVEVGKKVTIQISNKNKKATYAFKSSKAAVATVSKKGIVTAKKVGSASVVVTEKVKKTKRKLGSVKIKVKAVSKVDNTNPTQAPVESVAPATQTPVASAVASVAPSAAPTAEATVAPTAEPSVEPTPEPTEAPWDIVNVEAEKFADGYTIPNEYDEKKDGAVYPEYDDIEYYSNTSKCDRYANVIVPVNYDASKKYPVLYLFHGIGGNQNEWKKGFPDIILQNMWNSGEAKEMVVVIPNCRAPLADGSGNNIAEFDNFINDFRDDLMPYIEKNYSVYTDRNHTAVAGLSMGGRGALDIGMKMVDRIGYIGAFEPAPGAPIYSEDKMTLPEWYMDRTFIFVVKGKEDTTVNEWPLLYHNKLTDNQVPHIYYEVPGDHTFKVWSPCLYNFAKRIFNHD